MNFHNILNRTSAPWVCLGISGMAALFFLTQPILNMTQADTPKEPQANPVTPAASESDESNHGTSNVELKTATLGGGCFWCVEAVFERLPGVKDVRSGYSAGHVEDPTYEAVCNGTTGHAEVVQIDFDPDKISFEQILGIFWQSHDPTTLNRQGADVGTQYRSIILYHDESQKKVAEKSMKEAAGLFRSPIVTQLEAFEKFYAAEDYHQDYFKNNPNAPYCYFVIKPKLEKLKKLETSESK